MARRVFFSFHYQYDIFRVNQIRKSNIVEGVASAGFIDASIWEKALKSGDAAAIKRMIDNALNGTTVTVVLIGSHTAQRRYINYEIIQSYKRGNGLLGIYIHNLKDINGQISTKGANPFDAFILEYSNTHRELLSTYVNKYDWYLDDGYNNFDTWIERSYRNKDSDKQRVAGLFSLRPVLKLRPQMPVSLRIFSQILPPAQTKLGISEYLVPPLFNKQPIPKPNSDLFKLLTPPLFNLPKKKH